MPSYTVFELSESDSPLATLRVLDQAFHQVCELAGFKPQWARSGATTTVTFVDITAKTREVSPRSADHRDAFEARRAVMKAMLKDGLWGFHAVTDREYREEIARGEEIERAQRRTMRAALQPRVVPITVMRDEGLPLAHFDGETIWRGKPG